MDASAHGILLIFLSLPQIFESLTQNMIFWSLFTSLASEHLGDSDLADLIWFAIGIVSVLLTSESFLFK